MSYLTDILNAGRDRIAERWEHWALVEAFALHDAAHAIGLVDEDGETVLEVHAALRAALRYLAAETDIDTDQWRTQAGVLAAFDRALAAARADELAGIEVYELRAQVAREDFRMAKMRESDPANVLRDWRVLLDRPDVLIVNVERLEVRNRGEIVHIAAIDTTGALRYHGRALPRGPIQQGAREVHPELDDALSELAAALAQLAEVLLVMGWNAPFDSHLLEQTAERHGIALPSFVYHDLLTDYRSLRRNASGHHTLDAACEREGVDESERVYSYRAQSDCWRVLAVMRAVVEAGADTR